MDEITLEFTKLADREITETEYDEARKELQQLKEYQLTPTLVMPDAESMQRLLTDIVNMRRRTDEFIEQLRYTSVKSAVQSWLENLKDNTRKNYSYYMADLFKRGIIPDKDVDYFNHVPHEAVLDYIKKIEDWSEGTRQLKAACYISFTAYLERISQGWFRRVYPSTFKANPTFYQINDKCVTKALKLTEWHRFIDALSEINHRDSLIARCMLQGAKRISEALELTLDQIDWEKNIIRFQQKKTGGMIKEIPISYPVHFMQEIKSYIDETKKHRATSKFVFITRNGKPLTRQRINFAFEAASKQANLPKVTPHMLRATWVTLAKEQNVQDTEIMKVTGHTSSKMIYAYDKTSVEDNFTKKFTLI